MENPIGVKLKPTRQAARSHELYFQQGKGIRTKIFIANASNRLSRFSLLPRNVNPTESDEQKKIKLGYWSPLVTRLSSGK